MSTPFLDEAVVTCPQCFGPAEPVIDGDTALYECKNLGEEDCGAEFGHRKVTEEEDACQRGIPAGVRLKYSAAQPPGVLAVESGTERQSVFLGSIGRRPSE